MAKEKRKRKANLHTPHVEDSEAPTSTSFYKGESDSSKDTRGWSSSSEWSHHTIFSSDPSSLFELSTTTPESMEENSSTDSVTSEEIDTRPIGPASIRSQRAHSWKKFMRRKPDSRDTEDPEEIASREMQKQINKLRVLDLHLPNTVHAEGQGLGEEELACVVRHLKDTHHPKIPSHFHRRVALTKGVVEARDPHDSPEVDAIRQKLLEDYAGSVFQDRTGGNPPIRGPHGEAEIILKAGAIPVKQRMFQIQGERRAAWVKLTDEIIRDDKIEPGISPLE